MRCLIYPHIRNACSVIRFTAKLRVCILSRTEAGHTRLPPGITAGVVCTHFWAQTTAVAIYTGYYYSAAHLGAAEAAAMAASGQTAMATIMTGYLSGFISSGNLNGAVEGAFSADLNYGIGYIKNPVANVGAHALEGGVMSQIQGGRFGHGFVSAGLSATINPKIAEHLGTGFKGGVAASIAGGTISQITGGKFANGALSSAFQFAFNKALHESDTRQLTKDENLAVYRAAQAVSCVDSRRPLRGNKQGCRPRIVSAFSQRTAREIELAMRPTF